MGVKSAHKKLRVRDQCWPKPLTLTKNRVLFILAALRNGRAMMNVRLWKASLVGTALLAPLLVVMTAAPASAAMATIDLTGPSEPIDLATQLAGSGVTVSNATLTGAPVAAGSFTGGTGIVGFPSGIILSSGEVSDVVGPNDSTNSTQALGFPGDAALTALGGDPTFDATILEFDFVPDAAQVAFTYVFGSEEYLEYVNQNVNDVFGFFVNGTNCALIAGGPVSINTVNSTSNSDRYIDNFDAHLDTQMDGLTTILTCTATVIPNASNHLKLAIADGGDSVLNSWVLLQAGTLTTAEICNNGLDDDGDGLIDSADSDCPPVEQPTTTTYTGAASVQYSDSATLSGTLTNGALVGIGGQTLDFTLGTQSTTAGPTDVLGSASTGLVVNQQPGSVTQVDTSFAGDATNAASADSDPFAILKEDCTLVYSGATTVLPLANTNLSAYLGEPDASLGDLSGKTVTFTVVDSSLVAQTFNAVTNAAGYATTSQALPANVYGVSVAFSGDDYYNGCGTAGETLVTVQAAGSKVTGGGWFVNGTRANFGLNLIPQAGGLWKGQLQLQVTNTKSRFHGSTAISAVSLAPNKVRWSGTGRWNGVAGFTFEVTVVDNGTSGKKGDTIDIKVYPTGSPGSPVYTSSGASPLKGGNLVVR